ncbi:MAG: hypothetical protein HQL07_14190 [Nitrospirae bacterium]|nr:hypothetical protein [Magnetococcales bacterium]HAT50870.1 hypothetical protein [Alphaproteobacteria bacterium]
MAELGDDSVPTEGPSFEQIANFMSLINPKRPRLEDFYIPTGYITFTQAISFLAEQRIENEELFLRDACFKEEVITWTIDTLGTMQQMPSSFYGHHRVFEEIKSKGMMKWDRQFFASKKDISAEDLKCDDLQYKLILFKKEELLKMINQDKSRSTKMSIIEMQSELPIAYEDSFEKKSRNNKRDTQKRNENWTARGKTIQEGNRSLTISKIAIIISKEHYTSTGKKFESATIERLSLRGLKKATFIKNG